jgi:hypothetical protein
MAMHRLRGKTTLPAQCLKNGGRGGLGVNKQAAVQLLRSWREGSKQEQPVKNGDCGEIKSACVCLHVEFFG